MEERPCKPCGANNDRHAYCRPSKKISTKTPGGARRQEGRRDAATESPWAARAEQVTIYHEHRVLLELESSTACSASIYCGKK